MAPPVTLGALLLVLALVPGWLYLRLVERLQPPSAAAGLHQLLEVLAVGIATTGLASVVVILVPHRWLPFTLDVAAWSTNDGTYLRLHPRKAAASAVLVFVVALALAYGLYLLRRLRRPKEFSSQKDVWIQSIGERPRGRHPYLGLHLTDGRLVQGSLHAYTFGAEAGKRDIALAGPIMITPKDETIAVALPPHIDRFVIQESKVEAITVHHAPALRTESLASRRRVALRPAFSRGRKWLMDKIRDRRSRGETPPSIS